MSRLAGISKISGGGGGGGGGFTYKGDWVAGEYAAGDLVKHWGVPYVCVADTAEAPVTYANTLVSSYKSTPVDEWYTLNPIFVRPGYLKLGAGMQYGLGMAAGPVSVPSSVTSFSVSFDVSVQAVASGGTIAMGVLMTDMEVLQGSAVNPTSWNTSDYQYGHQNNFIGVLWEPSTNYITFAKQNSWAGGWTEGSTLVTSGPSDFRTFTLKYTVNSATNITIEFLGRSQAFTVFSSSQFGRARPWIWGRSYVQAAVKDSATFTAHTGNFVRPYSLSPSWVEL